MRTASPRRRPVSRSTSKATRCLVPSGQRARNVVVGPRCEASRRRRDDLDAVGGIRRHESGLERPCEEAPHRLDEHFRRGWCCCAPVPPGRDVAALPIFEFRLAEFRVNAIEDMALHALRSRAQGGPSLRCVVSPKRRRIRALGMPWARRTGAIERSVIGRVELDRAELAGNADAPAFAAPKVPDKPLVASDLAVKEGWEFARHGGHHGTIASPRANSLFDSAMGAGCSP